MLTEHLLELGPGPASTIESPLLSSVPQGGIRVGFTDLCSVLSRQPGSACLCCRDKQLPTSVRRHMSSYGSCHGPLQVQASLWASCRLWWPSDLGHLDMGLSLCMWRRA